MSSLQPGKSPYHVDRWLGTLLLCLFALGAVAYLLARPNNVSYEDEKQYLALSQHLREGPGYSLDGVTLTACRPPGYAGFLAALQSLGLGLAGIRMAQGLLLLGCVMLMSSPWGPGRQRRSLLVVPILVAVCNPILLYLASTLYPQLLVATLFLSSLYLLSIVGSSRWIPLLAGSIFGLAIVVVPTLLPTLALTVVLARIFKIATVSQGALMVAAASLPPFGWALRNYIVFHRFVPFSTNSGLNFLLGNSEQTDPLGGIENTSIVKYAVQTGDMDEFAQNEFFHHAASEWITRHPLQAVTLYLEKVACFFSPVNHYAASSLGFILPWMETSAACSYLLLLGLVLWRLLDCRRFPLDSMEKMLLCLYLLSAFTLAIYFPRIRFRAPYDLLLTTVVIGYASQRLRRWLKSRGAAAITLG